MCKRIVRHGGNAMMKSEPYYASVLRTDPDPSPNPNPKHQLKTRASIRASRLT
jgi:hypothetical protein